MNQQPTPQKSPVAGMDPAAQVMQEFMQPIQGQNMKGSATRTCFSIFVILALILIFFIFGNRIFGIFHLDNVYHFILSIMILCVLYLVALFVSSFFIKYPKDLLTIVFDRLRN